MAKLLCLVVAIIVAITSHQTVFSQSLGVNTNGNTAHPNALLDVKNTTIEILIPLISKNHLVKSPKLVTEKID